MHTHNVEMSAALEQHPLIVVTTEFMDAMPARVLMLAQSWTRGGVFP